MNISDKQYGQGDSTFVAAGGEPGLTRLVDTFYLMMDTLPEAQVIRKMHPEDLTLSRQKLTYFLAGWMGGPRLYMQHFGSISIPKVHSHLTIDSEERDAWMLCMEKALDTLEYPESFKSYLLEQLFRPAEMIHQTSHSKHDEEPS
ncbi:MULTISPECIES: group II truncated hemoglobin [unclassified Oleiphilus]|jgi:hemoglobin|uniref:group II truncated hemoglobin n=2 Tax=Oleiphilus TaxID=141450 RepID=UPI0007C3FB0E|nr:MULTISPECIES: group II truncated hemoglobin [unclassified Oleiphilus]KZY49871.1 globin [Oleiphilus sp. HI0050]KZY75069.1 globin [Oleiphilus sp. HI0068]KZY84093.1 globin [Oleiphilus sp. HI0069]KZY95668.1 globin [Oleiphilus sp. HI0072]KZZ09985.1 globin [Oleiphilus sp. HI0078]KZZ22252.1 globin [Oleiphilus sp. HI0081]KZZ33640.1 globin [Oleiphilus sp. HI0085]